MISSQCEQSIQEEKENSLRIKKENESLNTLCRRRDHSRRNFESDLYKMYNHFISFRHRFRQLDYDSSSKLEQMQEDFHCQRIETTFAEV